MIESNTDLVEETLNKVDIGKLDHHIKKMFNSSNIDTELPEEEVKENFEVYFTEYLHLGELETAEFTNRVWKRIKILFDIWSKKKKG